MKTCNTHHENGIKRSSSLMW